MCPTKGERSVIKSSCRKLQQHSVDKGHDYNKSMLFDLPLPISVSYVIYNNHFTAIELISVFLICTLLLLAEHYRYTQIKTFLMIVHN